jgi:hypothetical protein
MSSATWSAVLRAGKTILSSLRGNVVLWSIGQLPVPQWLPEIGMLTPSDPVFAGYAVAIYTADVNPRQPRM